MAADAAARATEEGGKLACEAQREWSRAREIVEEAERKLLEAARAGSNAATGPPPDPQRGPTDVDSRRDADAGEP